MGRNSNYSQVFLVYLVERAKNKSKEPQSRVGKKFNFEAPATVKMLVGVACVCVYVCGGLICGQLPYYNAAYKQHLYNKIELILSFSVKMVQLYLHEI